VTTLDRLIAHLADGLSNAANEAGPPVAVAAESWAARFLRRFQHASADSLPFRRR